MPRLSVVLVVGDGQEEVGDGLESLADQPYRDVELLVIDNAAPAATAAALDRLAADDERVRVLHLSSALPTGAARNIGLDRADGDYLWFADPAVRLATDELARVGSRLDLTDPNVLVLDAVPTPVPGSSLAPDTLVLARSAASLVMRRRQLLTLGVRFGDGRFDDLSVTYPVLLCADLVDGVASPGSPRPGDGPAVPGPVSGRDAEALLAQYRVAFAVLDASGCRAAVRGLLTGLMVAHGLELATRLPVEERQRFEAALAAERARQERGPAGSRGDSPRQRTPAVRNRPAARSALRDLAVASASRLWSYRIVRVTARRLRDHSFVHAVYRRLQALLGL